MTESRFTKNLVFLMRRRELSAYEVAHAIGVPTSTITRLSSGAVSKPRNATVVALAQYFDIDTDDLTLGDAEALAKEGKLRVFAVNKDGGAEMGGVKLPIPELTELGLQMLEALGGPALEAEFQEDIKRAKRWLPAIPDASVSDTWLCAYRVTSDFMAPTLPVNSIVYMSTGDDVQDRAGDNSIVLASTADKNQLAFGRLKRTPAGNVLVSDNPALKTLGPLPVSGIYAVVVAVFSRLTPA